MIKNIFKSTKKFIKPLKHIYLDNSYLFFYTYGKSIKFILNYLVLTSNNKRKLTYENSKS